VRPVLKSLDQHLYVLSTLALALMIQQVAAIKWGTEPAAVSAAGRAPAVGSGTKIWLPVVACALTILVSISLSSHPGRPRLLAIRRG